MFDSKNEKPALLTVGTPQCALACAALGAVVAVLFLTIGFWKTLFIALFIFAGLFAGGVKDKRGFLREAAEAVAPRRELKVYQATGRSVPSSDDADGEDDAEEETEEDTEEEAEEEDAGEPEEDGEDEEENDEAPEDSGAEAEAGETDKVRRRADGEPEE